MRTIIAGSRHITNQDYLLVALDKCGWKPTVVLCGMAKGADMLGYNWALLNSIPIEKYPACWKDSNGRFDITAGFKRNALMAKYAEALIALWDGETKGTGNMITLAKQYGLKVYTHLV